MKAPRLSRRCVLSGLLAAAAAPLRAADGPGSGGLLVMFRRRGCPWCEVWDREVRPGWATSPAGQAYPLVELDLDLDRDRDHGIGLVRPVRYTPTFVLVTPGPDGSPRGGRERERIEGYPGADFFWGYVEGFLVRHGSGPGG